MGKNNEWEKKAKRKMREKEKVKKDEEMGGVGATCGEIASWC